jgi:hypothetical protein
LRVRLPPWLPQSAHVDLLALRAGIRVVMRTIVRRPMQGSEVRLWFLRQGFFCGIDADGFVVVSRHPNRVRRTLALDRASYEHTYALGIALGYPACCARRAARVGESGIDSWAKIVSGARYVGHFKLIDPSGYATGRAFVSHVPCSASCTVSLRQARHLLRSQRLRTEERTQTRDRVT